MSCRLRTVARPSPGWTGGGLGGRSPPAGRWRSFDPRPHRGHVRTRHGPPPPRRRRGQGARRGSLILALGDGLLSPDEPAARGSPVATTRSRSLVTIRHLATHSPRGGRRGGGIFT